MGVSLASNNYGGGIAAQDSGQVFLTNSSMLDNFADDSGGAIYLDTGDAVGATLKATLIQGNYAKSDGCGASECITVPSYLTHPLRLENSSVQGLHRSLLRICLSVCAGVSVGREAFLRANDSRFVSNGGISSTGKNEQGGAIASGEGRITLVGCTFFNNTAIDGGALYSDEKSKIAITSTEFLNNTADQIGGAIKAADTSVVTIQGESSFEFNGAQSGGAIAAVDKSNVTLRSTTLSSNAAQLGGGLYVETEGLVQVDASTFSQNMAVLGGAVYVKTAVTGTVITDSLFSKNNASARGGAFYFEQITVNMTTAAISCQQNVAASGGCMFWVTNKSLSVAPEIPCRSCTFFNNSLYDIATNTRSVGVLWWPNSVYSGLDALELPDEESFKPMDTLNKSISQTIPVWPRLKALDLYSQVEVLDTETACVVKPVADENGERVSFKPLDYTTAVAGVVLYDGAIFTGVAKSDNYTLNLTCTLPKREKDVFFLQNVTVLPCEPGYATENEYVALMLLLAASS